MIVKPPTLRRSVNTASFSDITSKECLSVGWVNGDPEIQFAVNLSDDEVKLVKIRCMSPDDGTETLLRSIWTAYNNNLTFLALSSPTAAQVSAQVAALTRQMQGVFRNLAPID